jgi:hypothetical protein
MKIKYLRNHEDTFAIVKTLIDFYKDGSFVEKLKEVLDTEEHTLSVINNPFATKEQREEAERFRDCNWEDAIELIQELYEGDSDFIRTENDCTSFVELTMDNGEKVVITEWCEIETLYKIQDFFEHIDKFELLEDYDNDDDGEGVVFYKGGSGYVYSTWRYKGE